MSRSHQTLLLPVKPWFVWFSLLCGLSINLLPWRNNGLMLQPDFVAVLLLYWHLYEPERISIGWGFTFGLLMDIADTSLFGQHALAYVVMLYLSSLLARRMRLFGFWNQAIHVLPLLLSSNLIMSGVRLLADGRLPTPSYFSAPLIGAVMWPFFVHLLQWPQRRARESEL
ncbi:rod shape-determining protein MreD [Leeia sp. TBRC 13508]|uniref:Rod shape-determining protein MreD n=1 Tax=Leeia speluncae TaxID=2884804 RepID=A0ABS8D7C1_9NEIS|nr:rod shape-determining protein MreD [Leeia speluncae]MCB6184104.1 rod shape-determining protein MreD [Leeia speluncae]